MDVTSFAVPYLNTIFCGLLEESRLGENKPQSPQTPLPSKDSTNRNFPTSTIIHCSNVSLQVTILKKKLSFSHRQRFFAVCLLLLFLCLLTFFFLYKRDEKRFAKLTEALFTEEMTANTLNMHYTLATPENFGIYNYTPTLSLYSREEYAESCDTLADTLKDFQSINADKLSDSDAYLLKILIRTLENSLALNQYHYYSEPLSPSSGMQSQLPILLAEYTFRTKRDVEDYLALLNQCDAYFRSLLVFEQEKAAQGLIMPAAFLEEVQEQCDTIVTIDELNSGTHFLQTTFHERIEKLCQEGKISAEDVHNYLLENDEQLKNVLVPAYKNLSEGLAKLEDTSILPKGLAATEEGRTYYEQLLISETGSYRSPKEIQELLLQAFETEYATVKKILNEHPQIAEKYITGKTSQFPLRDASQMLLDLQTRMFKDFPSLPDGTTQVALKSVSESLEEHCAPAFYLTTPIDDSNANSIYINHAKTPDGLQLYTTLAHEGYPGHLYQNVYFNRSCLSSSERPARQLLWYGGYLEGWALYVEFHSFDYATELLSEQEQTDEATIAQLEKHSRSLQLCLYSLLDILIHYENTNYSQIADLLDSFGIRDSESAKSIYNYIVQEPCNYLKYYLGYLEILELQEDARTLWGCEYSDYRFHCFYLDCGPSDFSSLQEQLQTNAPSLPAQVRQSISSTLANR